MPMKPKEMIRLLKKNGFIKISQNGSHVKMKNFKTGKQTTVPLHQRFKKRTRRCHPKTSGLKIALFHL